MSTKVFKALREFDGGVRYEGDDDDVGTRACCRVASYKPHAADCDFMVGLREYESLLKPQEFLVHPESRVIEVHTLDQEAPRLLSINVVQMGQQEPKVGDVFWNPELGELRRYNGDIWVRVP